jgi:beta-xylosidase
MRLVTTFLFILSNSAVLYGVDEPVVGGAGPPGQGKGKPVSQETMEKIYKQVKTPYKYGILIKGQGGKKVDCPSVFRYESRWYMMYLIFDGDGYETAIAESNDLLHWKTLGKILTFKDEKVWDANQVGGTSPCRTIRGAALTSLTSTMVNTGCRILAAP